MESRRELFVAIGALVATNVFLAFGAVALLSRMTPAVERIMKDNVDSMHAAAELLAVLATESRAPFSEPSIDRASRALTRLRSNITESDEPTALASIGRNWQALRDGAVDARAPLVRDIQALIATNHRAMRDADAEAKRLGNAGAWAVALMGVVALLLSVAILRRLSRRLLKPLAELFQTLQATRRGDSFRRCTISECARELQQVMRLVNHLLDAHAQPPRAQAEDQRLQRPATG